MGQRPPRCGDATRERALSLSRVRPVLIMQFLHKQAGTLASFLPFSISMAICFKNTSVIFILSLLEVGDWG